MAFTVTNPNGEGTDAELLAITRGMIAQITVYGHAYDMQGNRVDRASLKDLREQIEWLEKRINAVELVPSSATNYAERRRAL
jgi:hypothetical protein